MLDVYRLRPLPGRVRRGGGVDLSEEVRCCGAAWRALLTRRRRRRRRAQSVAELRRRDEGDVWRREKWVWFVLYEAARESMKHSSTIVLE